MFRRANISFSEMILVFILITAGAVIMFIKPLLAPENILHFSDAIHVWYFFKTFTINAIKQYGYLPLWNPLIYSGVPFVGNPQSTLFYPPFSLFYIIPVHYAITLLFTMHIAFAGCGMYLYARLRRLSFAPAWFASIVFVLNYKLVGIMFAGHLTHFASWTYFPWMLIGIEYYVHSRKFRAMILLSLCYAFLFLAGLPQIFYYQLLVGLVYLILTIAYYNKKEAVGILIGYAFIAVMAVLFVAISLFPVWEMMHFFQRSGGTNFAFSTTFSLHWKDFISLVFPQAMVAAHPGPNIDNKFFWEHTMYCGIIPLIFLFISYRWREWLHTGFFVVLLIFSVLFALGDTTPFFGLMYKFIPGVSYFRCPNRIFVLAAFSVSILSAFAFQNMLEDRYFLKIRSMYRLSLLLAIIFIAVHEIVYYRYQILIPHSGAIIAYLFIFSLVAYMWHKGYANAFVFATVIIGITVCDLGSLSFPLIKSEPLTKVIPSSGFYNGIINDRTIFRIYDTAGAYPQYFGALTNVQQIGGDEPVILSNYLDYIKEINMPVTPDNDNDSTEQSLMFPITDFSQGVNWPYLHFLNMKYLITTYPLDQPFLILEDARQLDKASTQFFEGVYPIVSSLGGALYPKTFLYRNTAMLPRGFLLPARQDFSADQVLDRFLASPRRNIEPAVVQTYEPNKVVFQTVAPETSYLITSEIFYPGWKVMVDGEENSIIPVMDMFRAVKLEAGSHEVEFVYHPDSFYRGRKITVGWLGCCLILIVIRLFQSKNTKKEFLLPVFFIFFNLFF